LVNRAENDLQHIKYDAKRYHTTTIGLDFITVCFCLFCDCGQFALRLVFFVFVYFVIFVYFILVGQSNWLPGKTHLRNDLLRVEWDFMPYSLAHSVCTKNCWQYVPVIWRAA